MQQINQRPLKHILVCVNERPDRECCAKVKGMEIFNELKQWARSSGLSSAVWVTKTGCLGFCNKEGTTIAIYPDQIWLKEAKIGDLESIKQMILDSINI